MKFFRTTVKATSATSQVPQFKQVRLLQEVEITPKLLLDLVDRQV
jgi:hypothetical protein